MHWLPIDGRGYELMPQDFEWKSSYSVGHIVLDRQHQQLFRLCKQASECAAGNSGDFTVVLNDLVRFAIAHFDTEEAFLKSCNYAELEAQENDHHDFMVKIMDFCNESMASKVDKVAFAAFAWAWWKSRVLISDMQYRSTVLKLRVSI